MIFRDVQLINAGKSSEEKLAQNRYLMNYWENLRDIFCTFLPNKLDLNGISKVNIYLGKFDGENYIPPGSDGIAAFKRSDFDFTTFQNLSVREKNEKSLFYVEDSLLQLCDKFKLSKDVSEHIKKTSEEVLRNDFELLRTFKKTTKWNKSRSLRAITFLHHKNGGIDVKVSIENKKGEPLVLFDLMQNAIWNTVWFEFFKGYWQGTEFVIEDRLGKKVFAYDSSISEL